MRYLVIICNNFRSDRSQISFIRFFILHLLRTKVFWIGTFRIISLEATNHRQSLFFQRITTLFASHGIGHRIYTRYFPIFRADRKNLFWSTQRNSSKRMIKFNFSRDIKSKLFAWFCRSIWLTMGEVRILSNIFEVFRFFLVMRLELAEHFPALIFVHGV